MTTVVTNGGHRSELDTKRLEKYIERVSGINSPEFNETIIRMVSGKDEITTDAITKALTITAVTNIDEANVKWTYDAARFLVHDLYRKASANRSYDKDKKYGNFYELLNLLADKGIYSRKILDKYSKDEIDKLSEIIVPERDLLFDYIGLKTLADRYLAKDHFGNTYELPQERWLVIAMYLMQDEPKATRMHKIKESYWATSNLYMTVATPTLANAGMNHGQMSSCFIDTVSDSLQGIYDNNTDIANLSKEGGGIGIYMGKVRSKGSTIKDFIGASSGTVPWIRQLNNTAVAVDQLGKRQGAVAIYLDVWHKDLPSFLDLKLNNGDDRLRAHDIFTGVCLPDIFMETVDARGDWFLFDPHEVRKVMGYSLEDYYDEKEGSGSFRDKYMECVNTPELSRTEISAIDIMKRVMKSQLETGTPYMFYRDEVNRKNANKHEGMIYSSNLCTEIAQNMSATEFVETVVEGEDIIVSRRKAGDFVVCNLSSINLGRAVPAGVLDRLISIQVRMLDNVVDLNTIPVYQAAITNGRYRGIGLGTFGWHHLLALKGIHWETDEAVSYADDLYEEIAYLTIQASMELSKEKGAYPLFEGSDWDTGEYFSDRGYLTEDGLLGDTDNNWGLLAKKVKTYGIRNGYLMAVAPNSSTSIIAGSTASIDPIFKPFYHEEKKDFKLPIVAPDLDHNTYDIYRKSAYIVDQFWSIKQNGARQKHIDQAISFNIYVPNTIKASVLLELHLAAWKAKMKTTYYTRSTANDIEECEWCHS